MEKWEESVSDLTNKGSAVGCEESNCRSPVRSSGFEFPPERVLNI